MFSIFKIFKKKKIIPHIRLSGVIGSVGKFKQGLDLAGQQEIIQKAFSFKKTKTIAISINSAKVILPCSFIRSRMSWSVCDFIIVADT